MFSGIAKVCLEEGNKEYRQGEANNAINSYTEGLQVNCKDKRLNAKLYSNRATAHFRLGNNFISKYINLSCSVTRYRNTQSASRKLSLLDCNLRNCNFSGFFALISLDDHIFKPHFLNLTANYVECLDDATVAVQLEPTLIKAIKKGGFFRHKPSTFYSLISSKRILWFVAGDCTPSVNCIWCVNVCYVGKKHKKISISSQIPLPA